VREAIADIAAGERLLVACSGGADSLALALATSLEAPRLGLVAGGVTVDHGLQPGSAERAEQVAETLTELGLDPVTVRTVTVGATGGPEAAARTARYAALAAAADDLSAAAVLLGHTRDDQAETVLLGLARGSGARSLAGMAAVNGRYRRPLLDLDRRTVRAAVEDRPVWDDPHNGDVAFTRARVRQAALPALEAALGPGVSDALARTARLLRADADALDQWADRVRPQVVVADGELLVDGLAALPLAVVSRLLRVESLRAGAPAGELNAGHVEEMVRLVTDWHGQGPLHLPGRVRAVRRCGRLLLLRPS
jgi:tRNA(Ile)-lysidine synthase